VLNQSIIRTLKYVYIPRHSFFPPLKGWLSVRREEELLRIPHRHQGTGVVVADNTRVTVSMVSISIDWNMHDSLMGVTQHADDNGVLCPKFGYVSEKLQFGEVGCKQMRHFRLPWPRNLACDAVYLRRCVRIAEFLDFIHHLIFWKLENTTFRKLDLLI
jgi:hypothetical protein